MRAFQVKPGVKILTVVLFVLTVNLHPRLGKNSLLLYLAMLLIVIVLTGLRPVMMAKRLLQLAPFLITIFLFYPWNSGNLFEVKTILAKALLSGLALSIFSLTTDFNHILLGLQQIKCPGLFLTFFTMMYLSLRNLLEESRRMAISRDLRFFNRNFQSIFMVNGKLIGSLFLRTYERGERLTAAMACRGWTGKTVLPEGKSLRAGDGVFLLPIALIMLSIIIWVN